VGDVNRGPGSLGKFHVARDKIRVRVSFQDGDDFEVFAFGGLQVIVHIPLGIDHRRLPCISKQIRSVRQPLNIETFFEHRPDFRIGEIEPSIVPERV